MTIANIESLTRFLTNTDTTSLTAANLLILENKYYEEITGQIISETAGAKWHFGDLNYTAFPTFTISLSSGVQSYNLGNFTSVPLTIMGIEVLDNAGIWHPLKRLTLKDIQRWHLAQSEYQKTNARPLQYEIRDNLIVLYPAPDNGVSVTLANGLRMFYLRTADVFTSAQQSTGTKVPGFPSPWHDLLSYGPAYDFAIANPEANLPADRFLREYNRRMEEMLNFISRRDQDVDYSITGKRKLYR